MKKIEAMTRITNIEAAQKQDGTPIFIAHLEPIPLSREEAAELLRAQEVHLDLTAKEQG